MNARMRHYFTLTIAEADKLRAEQEPFIKEIDEALAADELNEILKSSSVKPIYY